MYVSATPCQSRDRTVSLPLIVWDVAYNGVANFECWSSELATSFERVRNRGATHVRDKDTCSGYGVEVLDPPAIFRPHTRSCSRLCPTVGSVYSNSARIKRLQRVHPCVLAP